jgi:hypothetical protein
MLAAWLTARPTDVSRLLSPSVNLCRFPILPNLCYNSQGSYQGVDLSRTVVESAGLQLPFVSSRLL